MALGKFDFHTVARRRPQALGRDGRAPPGSSINNSKGAAPQSFEELDVLRVGDELACVEINQCVGSHFSAMTRPCWPSRAMRNRHRHAIEQAARRWRGG